MSGQEGIGRLHIGIPASGRLHDDDTVDIEIHDSRGDAVVRVKVRLAQFTQALAGKLVVASYEVLPRAGGEPHHG